MSETSLIARFAGNVYWLGRYMERAENLARIIAVNEAFAREDSGGTDWSRIVNLYLQGDAYGAKHGRLNRQQVLHFYILDKSEPVSILSCVRNARENARSVRHLISTEMWTRLNMFYGTLDTLGLRDLAPARLSDLCRDVVCGCQLFEGVAEGTFLRGQPWCFYQIGKYIERADQTTRLLDISCDRLAIADGDAVTPVHWNVLLRSVSGYHAYRSKHPGLRGPSDIAAFLLYDSEFPRAVSVCLEQVSRQLGYVRAKVGGEPAPAIEDARRALAFELDTGSGHDLTPQQLHGFLDRLQRGVAELNTALIEAYFI